MVSFYEMGTEAQRPQAKKRPWMDAKVMELVTIDTLERVINECILNPMYNKDKISEGGRPRNPEPIGSIRGCSGSPRASTLPSGAQTPACILSAAAHGLTGGAAAEQAQLRLKRTAEFAAGKEGSSVHQKRQRKDGFAADGSVEENRSALA